MLLLTKDITYKQYEYHYSHHFLPHTVNQTCTDYDVKLTYRDVTGRSGQLEICKNGTWHRTCSSTFSPTDIQVACNQLFGVFIGGEELSVILRQADVISETESYFTDSLACRGQETRLSDCLPPPLSDEGQPPPSSDEGSSPPPIGRRRRKRMITKEGATCFPSSQPTVMCPGMYVKIKKFYPTCIPLSLQATL